MELLPCTGQVIAFGLCVSSFIQVRITAACLLAIANCSALHVHTALAIMYSNQQHQVKATVSVREAHAHLNIRACVMNLIQVQCAQQLHKQYTASPLYSLPTSIGDLKSSFAA